MPVEYPDVGALGKRRRVDGAVLEIVEGAVVDEGDEIGAKLRVGDVRPAGGLDQAVAEEDAVLLVGELAGSCAFGAG